MDASDADAVASDDDSISVCIGQLKSGDPDAVQRLWERYSCRLVALAQKNWAARRAARMDENDVVQKAFSSFCMSARSGCFPNLHDRDSLWALLTIITARTAANQRVSELRASAAEGASRIHFRPSMAKMIHS